MIYCMPVMFINDTYSVICTVYVVCINIDTHTHTHTHTNTYTGSHMGAHATYSCIDKTMQAHKHVGWDRFWNVFPLKVGTIETG